MLTTALIIFSYAYAHELKCSTESNMLRDLFTPPEKVQHSVRVFFRNRAQGTVTLYEDGNDMGSVIPGQKRGYDTHTGNTWTAASHGKNLLLYHKISYVHVEECAERDVPFIPCAKKPVFNGPRWTIPDSVIFKNALHYPSKLFWWNGTCEEYVDEIFPRQTQHIQSTQGHVFRARSSNNSMIMQYTLQDIIIADDDDNVRTMRLLQEIDNQIKAKNVLQTKIKNHNAVCD